MSDLFTKGGTTQSDMNLPDWWEDAARAQAERSTLYDRQTPPMWMGPSVAAPSPMQLASWDAVGNMGISSGMAPWGNQSRNYLPEAQTFAGGVRGYSGWPLIEENMAAVNEKYPGANDAFYELYPALAPEGYHAQSGLGGDASNMTLGQLMNAINENGLPYWMDGGDGSTGGDQGSPNNPNPTATDVMSALSNAATLGMGTLPGLALGIINSQQNNAPMSKNIGLIQGIMDMLGISTAASESGVGMGFGDPSGVTGGNMSGADAAGIGISGDDAGIGLGPDGGVAW